MEIIYETRDDDIPIKTYEDCRKKCTEPQGFIEEMLFIPPEIIKIFQSFSNVKLSEIIL
jgi:hypothetical protein